MKARLKVLWLRLGARVRTSARDRKRLLGAALVLVLLPPLLLASEALIKARLPTAADQLAVTRVYGRPLVLEPGSRPDAKLLADHLSRVGYGPARGREVGAGEYYLGRWGWIIGRRPFRDAGEGEAEWARDLASGGFVVARLDYTGRIAWMEDEAGNRLSRAFLEPELIGRRSRGADEDRVPVVLEEVPEELVGALLTVEDQRFFQHHGLDLRRIAAAAVANLKVGHVVQGGSTLTQQLAKNLYLSPRRSLDRKLREAAMALVLELRSSKAEILEAYLNEVYLGQEGAVAIRGVGGAADYFFGKGVASLEPSESALLVALIRAPSLYSPVRHPETARERRNLVLRLMREGGVITDEELQQAVSSPLGLRRRPEPIGSARYFLDFALGGGAVPEESAPTGAVVTTLDPRLQRAAEGAVRSGLQRLEGDFDWLREGDRGEPLQAALVAMDPRTGELLAMVGGRDYGTSQFNRAVEARRQPGSAFKPVVALTALAWPQARAEEGEVGVEMGSRENGEWAVGIDPAFFPAFTLASLLEDGPFQVETPAGPWQPANYDGTYGGPVTLRDALERSLNVPFARLGMEVGPERIVETARALGIESPLKPYPSLALGSGEVTPLELTRAFGVLAAGGWRADLRSAYSDPPRPPASTPSRFGGVAEWGTTADRLADSLLADGLQVFDAAETYLVTSALRGAVERGTGRGIRSHGFYGDVAAKSGTTNDFRDGWFVGYTPSLVVGVWVGFDRGKRLELPGAGVALPIFESFLEEAVGPYGDEGPWASTGFSVPPGIESVEVDSRTGLRGGWGCPGDPELFLEGTAPARSCNGFRLDRRLFQRIVDVGSEEGLRLLRRLLGITDRDGGG